MNPTTTNNNNKNKSNITNPPLKHSTTTTTTTTTTDNKNNNNNNPPLNASTGALIPHKNNSSSTTTTCASCRYFRRKCKPDCLLAPYFPPQKDREFLNLHKLHGVCFVVKILNSIPPRLRDDAMTSFIYSANARARDPVGGCKRIIEKLYQQVLYYLTEFVLVRERLLYHRTQFQPPLQDMASQLQLPHILCSDVESMVNDKLDLSELIQFFDLQ